jgi:ribonucleoside-diphosphate reductase beta chain
LEGLYFYNGFAFFDTLADHQKMKATDRMISYIRRDELTHVTMFTYIIKEIEKEFPNMFKKEIIYEMFKNAVDQEIKRSQFILGNNIIGINHQTTENYTKRLANNRLNLI